MDLKLPALDPGPATGGDGKAEDADTRVRRILKVSEWDLKPVLLYFHYPHEDEDKPTADGRASKKQCGQLIEEEFSRWGILFRCYEVDMSASDRAFAEKVGAGTGTSFALVNGKGEPFARSGTFANVKALRDWLQKSLKDGTPLYWDALQKQVAEQKTLLEEARALAKKQDWKAAKTRYDEIRGSTLRIGEHWDAALDEAAKVEAKAKRS